MFIAANRIQVPSERRDMMANMFRKNAESLKGFPGFIGFELWFEGEDVLQSVSRWESKDALQAYTKSELFAEHHASMRGRREHAEGSDGGQHSGISASLSYYTAEVLV